MKRLFCNLPNQPIPMPRCEVDGPIDCPTSSNITSRAPIRCPSNAPLSLLSTAVRRRAASVRQVGSVGNCCCRISAMRFAPAFPCTSTDCAGPQPSWPYETALRPGPTTFPMQRANAPPLALITKLGSLPRHCSCLPRVGIVVACVGCPHSLSFRGGVLRCPRLDRLGPTRDGIQDRPARHWASSNGKTSLDASCMRGKRFPGKARARYRRTLQRP